MDEKSHTVFLELYGPPGPATTGLVYYRGDQNVYPIEIHLMAAGKPYAIADNAIAYVNCRRPDGVVDRIPAEISDSAKGIVDYYIAGTEISVPGACAASVNLETATDKLSWPAFRFLVQAGLDNAPADPPGAYVEWTRNIDQQILALEARVATLEQAAYYTLPPATTSQLGGVIAGDNIAVAPDGTISAAAAYTLPIADRNVLGGVKIGVNVVIAGDGTINLRPMRTITVNNALILNADSTILVAGAVNNVSLPALPPDDDLLTVKNTTGSTLTVRGNGNSITLQTLSASSIDIASGGTVQLQYDRGAGTWWGLT